MLSSEGLLRTFPISKLGHFDFGQQYSQYCTSFASPYICSTKHNQ